MYVYRYIDIVFRLWFVLVVACGVLVLLARSAFLLVLLVSCCAMRALLSVVIWCTRATMRCNRFFVLGGVVFTLCAIVRLWRVLQAFTVCLADGVTVCASRVACCLPLVWLVLVCAVVCCLLLA